MRQFNQEVSLEFTFEKTPTEMTWYVYLLWVRWLIIDSYYLNTSKKETSHSFKGQQLENKSLYRLVIYIGL